MSGFELAPSRPYAGFVRLATPDAPEAHFCLAHEPPGEACFVLDAAGNCVAILVEPLFAAELGHHFCAVCDRPLAHVVAPGFVRWRNGHGDPRVYFCRACGPTQSPFAEGTTRPCQIDPLLLGDDVTELTCHACHRHLPEVT